MSGFEKIARLNLCRFSRKGLVGLYASPNPRQRLSPLETATVQECTDTVSDTVSAKPERAVKNSGELDWINLGFTGEFVNLLALHRTFQVAARRPCQLRTVSGCARRIGTEIITLLSRAAASGARCVKNHLPPNTRLRQAARGIHREKFRTTTHMIHGCPRPCRFRNWRIRPKENFNGESRRSSKQNFQSGRFHCGSSKQRIRIAELVN
jgi:hypothetical protein